MRWLNAVVLLMVYHNSSATKNTFNTVSVETLARDTYGTELILLENSLRDQKSYRFEDFFWTGSGDGSDEDDNSWTNPSSTTIYKTKTIFTTVFLETSTSSPNDSSIENTTKCSINCHPTIIPDDEISPTPTIISPSESTYPDEDYNDIFDADRQFWLLTILKSDGKDPIIVDLKNSLAKLYKTAFQRQQDRHLGINGRIKRHMDQKPVHVYIHKIDKTKVDGDEQIQVLYHVTVDGKPVAAVTAADDMHLVSDEEVQKELGYPFLVKAEPYLKETEPQSLSTSNNTWIFIGVSIVGLLILLLIIAFFTLGVTKRKRQAANVGLENRKHIFERGVGHENKGFVEEGGRRQRNNEESPTYINFRNQRNGPKVSGSRSQSSMSSSSAGTTSLDISPLMGLKKQRTPPRKPPRPKAATNKTVPINVKRFPPEVFDSDSSSSVKESPEAIYPGNYDPGVVSPKSYLSMPSVKSFPRGNMPEPLNKVLEPVSVLHLDMPNDELDAHLRNESYHSTFIRHGSVGAVEDTGVIGPIVWNMHKQRLQHGVSVDEGIDDLKVSNNLSKMRKRFHDLLDDTFSLFGSRRESPVHDTKSVPIEVKSHSASNAKSDDSLMAPTPKPRPKTAILKKTTDGGEGVSGPRGAWASSTGSPLVRPVSAGIINRPRVNVDHILAEGRFRQNDPAVPLIAAIKTEIEKCSLPGSAADLRD